MRLTQTLQVIHPLTQLLAETCRGRKRERENRIAMGLSDSVRTHPNVLILTNNSKGFGQKTTIITQFPLLLDILVSPSVMFVVSVGAVASHRTVRLEHKCIFVLNKYSTLTYGLGTTTYTIFNEEYDIHYI